MGIVKNWRQPSTLLQQQWIHHFFIACAHVNYTILFAQHPQSHECTRATSNRCTVCSFFIMKNPTMGKYLDASDLAGMMACRLPFLLLITHVHHKPVPKATRMCRGSMVLKNGKLMKWLLIVCNKWIYFILLVDNPTRSSSMVFLFTSRCNNEPLKIWKRMLGSNLSSGGTGCLRREHSLRPTELGTAGIQTGLWQGGLVATKVVRKMVEKVWNDIQRYTGDRQVECNNLHQYESNGRRRFNISLTFFCHHRWT